MSGRPTVRGTAVGRNNFWQADSCWPKQLSSRLGQWSAETAVDRDSSRPAGRGKYRPGQLSARTAVGRDSCRLLPAQLLAGTAVGRAGEAVGSPAQQSPRTTIGWLAGTRDSCRPAQVSGCRPTARDSCRPGQQSAETTVGRNCCRLLVRRRPKAATTSRPFVVVVVIRSSASVRSLSVHSSPFAHSSGEAVRPDRTWTHVVVRSSVVVVVRASFAVVFVPRPPRSPDCSSSSSNYALTDEHGNSVSAGQDRSDFAPARSSKHARDCDRNCDPTCDSNMLFFPTVPFDPQCGFIHLQLTPDCIRMHVMHTGQR